MRLKKITCGAVLLSWMLCHSVLAQDPPLTVSMNDPAYDEFDDKLLGTHPASPFFGKPYVTGDLVQILQVGTGIQPPDLNGNPHPDNTLLYVTRIGDGISPSLTNSGRFAATVVPRPTGQVFARVFNHKNLGDSSFYGDSQIFTVNGDAIFYPVIAKTDSPLDPNDDDGDGLNNSWEKSYGSDPNDTDSDGDGVSDGDEHNTGTDPMDDGSAFVVARILLVDGMLTLEWDTVVGKKYQVEFTADSITGDPVYSSVTAVITAVDVVTQSPIPGGLANDHGCYRVRWLP